LLGCCAQNLFRCSLASCSTNTNHPDEQDQQDEEDDGSSNTSGDVSKLGFLLALFAGERSGALAVRVAVFILQTDTLILTEVKAVVATITMRSRSRISSLALARVTVGLLDEQAIGITIAKCHLAFTDATPRKKDFVKCIFFEAY
jgi:hypothetical protein